MYELEWYRVRTCVSKGRGTGLFFCRIHLQINHRYAAGIVVVVHERKVINNEKL